MARLIDADALKEKKIPVCTYDKENGTQSCDIVFVRHIDESPTVEAVPVKGQNITITNHQPMGYLGFSFACPRCRNIGTDLCRKCKMEVEGGFEPRIEAEPKNQPCHMCDSAFVNEELTRDNDLSYITVGDCIDGMRMMVRSGAGRPVEILVEGICAGHGWGCLGFYRPKYCPNCGRELLENKRCDPNG